MNQMRVSAPGRVCLFGEHQDYLGLPVIPCAISLRIEVEGRRRHDRLVHLDLPDVCSTEAFSLDSPIAYTNDCDYFRSALNVLHRAGLSFSGGFDCRVHGEIPISAGTASSSAMVVAWISFLAWMSDQHRELPPAECARLAHAAEVLEFGGPGGMMDQCAAAYGGTLFVEFQPTLHIETLDSPHRSFVLADSMEPKHTRTVLSKVKDRILDIVQRISGFDSKFSLHTIPLYSVDRYRRMLDLQEQELLRGTLRKRDLTFEAHDLLHRRELTDRALGDLLNEHQSILRDVLQVSTPKIDRLIDAALGAGARGAKINGSGGGGCMFAYAPENPDLVAEALNRVGGKAYIVHADKGVSVETGELA